MSHARSSWLAAVVCSVVFVGCNCTTPPVVQKDPCLGVPGSQADRTAKCDNDGECADHFGCKPVKDQEGLTCCVFLDRACTTEADCCPGQTCPADRKKCFDKFVGCQRDSDCGDKGDRFCETYTDTYGSSQRCRFHTCGALGECPDGQSCFQGECLADLPCNGVCDPGKACVPSIDRCQDYSMPNGRPQAACPMTCAAGFIATFKDPRNLWDACTIADVACVCAELPGLHSNDLGRFSAISADPGNALYVSTYDGQYGDLVVVKYDLTGKKIATEYVDGVPQATVKYGPSGARGGVVEPGPDVGRYSDVATAGGKVFVSYYDVTNGDLKVAVRGTDGKWASHKVDGAQADLGLYTSISVDSDGVPGVSYFQKGGDVSFNVMDCPAPRPGGATKFITALKFARATSGNPTSSTDWTVKTVSCAARPAPICDNCTGVCADPGTSGGGPGCYMAGTGCTGCTSSQSCVMVGAMAKCADKFTPPSLQQVMPGVGLFSSLAFKDKDAVIGFMKRTVSDAGVADGDLQAVTITAAGQVGTPITLDSSGDTGYFPDVKIEPSTKSIGIGFHDFSSKAFKFYFSPQLQAGVTIETIDTGSAGAGDQGWVGTDSAIVFGANATVWALYQDATRGDLKMSKRTSSWQSQTSPRTDGAVGFFADAVLSDGKIYASHARIHARLVQSEPQVDNSLLLETLPGQ